ncbi:MAG: C10 family peptidase [Victivallales bacterium]|nr:C10 family peptidase [Victivallales bacterium]
MYDVNGKPQTEITCSDSFSFTVDSISDANKYSANTGTWTNENYNHCWIATAANMLVQQGYYTKGAEQELFDLLSKYYYYKKWHKSTGGYAKDIFDELLGENSYRIHTDFNPLQVKEEMAFGPVNLFVLSVTKNSEGRYGSHVVTAYDIEFDNDKPVGIYFTDSDDLSNNGRTSIHNYKFKYIGKILNKDYGYLLLGYGNGNRWYIYNGESTYVLLPQSQTGLKLDIAKVRKYIDEHEKKIKFINGIISAISFGTVSNNYVVSGAGNLTVEGNAQVSTVTVQSGGQLTAHSESSISNIIIDESGTVNLETNSTVGGSVDIYGGSLSVEGDVMATDAEVIFHISEITPTTESLSSGLNHLQGTNYSIILDRFQGVGDYLLASDSIGMEQSFSIYGETLVGVRGTSGSTVVYNNPDFVDGYLGELNIGNTLQVGNVIYSLNYENNDDLVFSVSYTPDVDVTAPTVPGNLSATIENLTVTLDWSDSVDENGITSYLICYGQDEDLTDAEYVVSDASFSVIENLNTERYYYQVCAIDNNGNFSDWSEVKEFTVNPLIKDLVASNLSLSQNCYDQEGVYRLNWNMTNISTTASSAGYSKIIISTDEIFDQYDTELALVYTGALAAGETIADNQQILVPNRFMDGDYFIGFVADCGADANADYYYDYDNVTWLDFNAFMVDSSNYGQLLTSRTWGQNTPWNDYCPLYPYDTTKRTIAGCGPIAAAQILYALKSPVSLSFDSSDAYTKAGISIDSNSGNLDFPSFAELNSALANIKYDGSNEEMAMLSFAVGVKLQASYTASATSSWIPASFFTEDCGFDSAHWISTSSSETSAFKNADGTFKQEYLDVIAQNVQQGSPVLLLIPKHFVFIEDYDKITNKFYINYGWGDGPDGWYDLHDINGNCVEGIMIDIIPEYDGSVITVTRTDDYGVGTLRRAIELANSIKGANTIVIDPSLAGQTISLNSRLEITDQVTIVGLADSGVTINRNYDGYVFYLDSGSAGSRLSGMTIDGNAKSSYLIYNYSSNNTFENLKFQNFIGTYGLDSYYYTATVDASSDFNGYSARGTITYVPDAVANANAIGRSSSIDFSWESVRDKEDGTIMNYRLEYSLSADMANASSATVFALSYRLANVSAGKNYYWRVCGIDSNGNKGIYSEVQRVYTGTDVTAPTVVNGLNADVDDIRVTLSWNAAQDSGSGISHYLLEYSEHNDFSDKTIISTQSTKYKLSGLKNNAMYYWRVAAVDLEGNVGKYSQIDEFMPSANSLLISDKQNQTIETTRKLHITETGSCEIDGSNLDDSRYTYLVRATGYETELYIDGDLTLIDGRGGAYGIYGKNIIDGSIVGNISLSSDYEIPENGNIKYVYGLYASNLRLSEFSSMVSISSEKGIHGSGIRANDAFLRVNVFSGIVSVDVEKHAYGIGGPRDVYIGVFEETSNLIIKSSNEEAYGIYSILNDTQGYGLNGSITINKLNGTIIVSSETDNAYGVYDNIYNAESASMTGGISICDWNGSIEVSAKGNAYGIRHILGNTKNGGVSGTIDIGDMDGLLIVKAIDRDAYGFYFYLRDSQGYSPNESITINKLNGTIVTTSESGSAQGVYVGSDYRGSATITGTISINDWNGNIQVLAKSSAYGINMYLFNGGNGSVSGTIDIGNMNGSMDVISVSRNAYGLYNYSGATIIDKFNGIITVTSENWYSYGLYSRENLSINEDINGVIVVTAAARTAYALYGNSSLNASISGIVFAGAKTEDNDVVTLVEKLNYFNENKEELVYLSQRHYSVYVIGKADIALSDEALLMGKLKIGDESQISISGGASIYGDVTTNDATVHFVLDDNSLKGTRWVMSKWNNNLALSVNADNILTDGAYSLLEANDLSSISNVTFTSDGQTQSLNIGKTITVKGVTYILSNEKTSSAHTLTLTVSGIVFRDREAPVLKGSVVAEQGAGRTATLSWEDATDNVGVTGYELKYDGHVITVNQSNYVLNNVTLGSHTIQIRAFDQAGNHSNWSAEQSVVFEDSFAPVLMSINATPNTATNQNVIITVEYEEDFGNCEIQYRFSNETNWRDYHDSVAVTSNKLVFFRALDEAGNISDIIQYQVDNIDTKPPVAPSVTANTQNLTNTPVILTASYSDDSVVRQYRVSGGEWLSYASPISISTNTTVAFRGQDAAGNWSKVTAYDITNIDMIAPVITLTGDNTTPRQSATLTASTEEGVDIYWSTNNATWKKYEGALDVTENKTYYFKATDAAGNIGMAHITFANIDTIAPVISLTGDNVTPQKSTQLAASTEVGVDIFWSTDNVVWKKYSVPLNVTANGTWYFKATDAAGNTGTTQITFANIDRVAPTISNIRADVTSLTNGKVTVTASASDDANDVSLFYSKDDGAYVAYDGGVEFTANGKVVFKAVDAAGNETFSEAFEVTNIDKVAPVIRLTGDNSTPRQSATLTASTEAGIDIYWSPDNAHWTKYEGELEITSNGTYYFKAKDAAGNKGVNAIKFTNIDTTAPVITLNGDNVTPQKSTTLTASTEAGVDIYWSTDNVNWAKYEGELDITANGEWYFKAMDAAGNTGMAQIAFTNIDTVAPEILNIAADVTAPTNGKVIVTANASDDVNDVTLYYSKDGGEFVAYNDGVEFTANGNVVFKAVDAAGNETFSEAFEITNIDKVAPVIELLADTTTPLQKSRLAASTEAGVDIYWSMDNVNWSQYDSELDITANGTWYFKATDTVGNTGVAQIAFTNIDIVKPTISNIQADVTALTNGKVTVTASASDAANDVTLFYSKDGGEFVAYDGGVEFTDNGNVVFKAIDAAGNETVSAPFEIMNIDKVAPVIELTGDTTSSLQATKLTASTEAGVDIYWSMDNKTWTKYEGELDVTANGTYYFKATDAAGNTGTNSIIFANIDTVAPAIELLANSTTPLQSAKLTASTEAGLDIYWSTDNANWTKYDSELNVTANDTYYFKATDAAGNTGVAQIVFENIDTVAPSVAQLEISHPDESGLVKLSVVANETLSKLQYSWKDGDWLDSSDGTISVAENGSVRFRLTDIAGNVSVTEAYAVEAFDIIVTAIVTETTGDGATFSWGDDGTAAWADQYDVVIGTATGNIDLPDVAAEGVELLNAPSGEVALSVKPNQSDIWSDAGSINVQNVHEAISQFIEAEGNGLADVIFTSSSFEWNDNYQAQHVGVGEWEGTRETTELAGKNAVTDVFVGSDDASILLMTDDENGDALFIDDIYSAFPEGLDAQARVAKIDEIRAGAGDDIIDLTSQRFDYVGGGMTVKGGLGNDVIWSNKGDNTLFGDAGNDRIVGAGGNDVIVGGSGDDSMHGGGGEDIFTFGGNWGNDSVEQLEDGKVTLWFDDGDESKWDASMLTYRDGDKSVVVNGVTAENITLKFGDDGSEQYGKLLANGAFDEYSSERIFENKNSRGMLA